MRCARAGKRTPPRRYFGYSDRCRQVLRGRLRRGLGRIFNDIAVRGAKLLGGSLGPPPARSAAAFLWRARVFTADAVSNDSRGGAGYGYPR